MIDAASNQSAPLAPTRLIPINKWHDYHPWPSTGGLRHLIFHEETNGFSAAIRRVGRRILIDEQAFFEWVENSNQELRPWRREAIAVKKSQQQMAA